MDVLPPSPGRSVELDSAPPRPPASEQSALMRSNIPSPPEGGVGVFGNSPNLMALQGLAIVKHGLTLLSQALPSISPLLNQSYMQLEQIIPTVMADQLSGAGPAITGQPGMAQPAPPGVAPMMTPPPGPMGGPPGAMPGPQGAGAPLMPPGAATRNPPWAA